MKSVRIITSSIAIRCVANLVLLAIAGCTKSVPFAPPGYLQIDLPTAPSKLDPRITTDAVSSRISELLYDSLVRMDRDGNFTDDLADSFERPSPTEIAFHLR